MNVILILIDSLNRHCLSPYGNKTVKTPNIDRFSKKAAVFDNHFVGSTPCMPARRELMTGRRDFFWRGWGPIEPFDCHIAAQARKAGTTTAIVTDHYHYWEYPAHGYIELFDSVKMIRGHELDMWNTDTPDKLPEWVEAINKWRPGWGTRYYNNVKDLNNEEDFFAPRTMKEASKWIERNHNKSKFFLWVESFDVHEPFHVPEPFRTMYCNKVRDDYTCWPPYQTGYHGHCEEFWREIDINKLEFIRSQYYAKVTMADKWLGTIFEKLDKYDLWDDTAVIITSDHGHELGEKGRFGKQTPHYDISASIPLMICHPSIKNAFRIIAFTTTVDIYSTILDILEADKSHAPHSNSLMPLLLKQTDSHRDVVVYSEFGAGATITNSDYTYHCSWDENAELNYYTALMLWQSPDATSGKYISDVDCPVWRIPVKSLKPFPEVLFDRRSDPYQEYDISVSNPKAVKNMRELLICAMDKEGVPKEQFLRLCLI